MGRSLQAHLMALLAETILTTLVALLEANMSATIYRGRVDPIEDTALPAVGVFQGGEEPQGDAGRLNVAVMDELLEVRTEVAARDTSANIETVLNELRRQIHLLLMAENPLGLAYVIDIIPNGVDEPVIDGESDKFTGAMVLNWLVYYRHNQADAGLAP